MFPKDTDYSHDAKETKQKSKRTRKEILHSINNVKEGDRNSSVVSIAGTLYARKIDLDFSIGLLQKWNKGCDNPLPEEELVQTIKHVDADYRTYIDYTQDFTLIHEGLKKQKVGDVAIGQEFFIWLQKNRQVQFFTDERGSHYIYIDKKLVTLDRDSSEFQVLLLNLANISTEKTNGRVACQVLNAKAHVEGTRINRDTWLHTNLEKLVVYINLKNQRNELVRLSSGAINLVQNGQNDDRAFMLNLSDDKLKPIEYKDLDENKTKQVFELIEQRLVRHIPTSDEDKWFSYARRRVIRDAEENETGLAVAMLDDVLPHVLPLETKDDMKYYDPDVIYESLHRLDLLPKSMEKKGLSRMLKRTLDIDSIPRSFGSGTKRMYAISTTELNSYRKRYADVVVE